MPNSSLNRRRFLCQSLVGASLGLAASKAPFVFAKNQTTLRVMGTHVTLQEEIRQQAMKDLGINLVFEARGESELVQKATSHPDQFDLYEQWTDSIKTLWQAGVIQPIDTKRLRYWNEINDISKKGRITPTAPVGLGDAPYKILNVQADGGLGKDFTGNISFLPYVHVWL
jgi:putative spermidine/putrescine transport system substrate-binding protein